VTKSSGRGASTSEIEVTNIDRFGFWVLLADKEYFLPFSEFPWFRNATLDQILKVELIHSDHLYWPELDIDLHLDSLSNPESFPLIYR
jgi:hypothetical protein